MSFLSSLFGKKETTASKAKDRLKVVLSHERAGCKLPYIDDLREDIIKVIKKYIKVDDVKINATSNQNIDTLEVEITLGK